MTKKKLSNKVAVVTGASKGIGASIAKHLSAEGASVVVNYASSQTGADGIVNEINAGGGKAIAIHGDITNKASIDRLFSETNKAYGKLDILVNNAGVYEFLLLDQITEQHFHKQFNLNVLALLLSIQEAVKQFAPDGGSIVNISSASSTLTPPGGSVYSASKAAVDAITKSLATELGARKIRVNSINPGLVETEGVHSAGFMAENLRKQIEAQTPLGRIGRPKDISSLAVFLASEDSSWITGENFIISGGYR